MGGGKRGATGRRGKTPRLCHVFAASSSRPAFSAAHVFRKEKNLPALFARSDVEQDLKSCENLQNTYVFSPENQESMRKTQVNTKDIKYYYFSRNLPQVFMCLRRNTSCFWRETLQNMKFSEQKVYRPRVLLQQFQQDTRFKEVNAAIHEVFRSDFLKT